MKCTEKEKEEIRGLDSIWPELQHHKAAKDESTPRLPNSAVCSRCISTVVDMFFLDASKNKVFVAMYYLLPTLTSPYIPLCTPQRLPSIKKVLKTHV
jgi:hypothetical protein